MAYGPLVGVRSVGRPELATTSWSSTRTRPAVCPADRLRARTTNCNQAELAWKLPDGTCSSPAPYLRPRIASSTTTCCRWNLSSSTAVPSMSEQPEVTPVGPQLQPVFVGETRASNDASPSSCQRRWCSRIRRLRLRRRRCTRSGSTRHPGSWKLASLMPLLEHLTPSCNAR